MSETQQDQDFIVSEAIGKTENFINQNKKSLGIIFGAVLVAIGGYIFYQNVYVANKEKEAQEVLFHAEQYLFADSLKLAINGDGKNPGLEEIVNDYSVSQSGNLARYYLGMAYLKNKEYDKAIENYSKAAGIITDYKKYHAMFLYQLGSSYSYQLTGLN